MRVPRPLPLLLAILAVVAVVAGVTVASGLGADDAGPPAPGGPGEIGGALTGRVVAGDEAGWVADSNGQVWRIDPDGTVAAADVRLPAYNGGFSTFFAGQVAFGGTRCDGDVEGEACDGDVVVEVRLVDEADESVEVVELRREARGYRSIGIGSYGSAGDQLVVHSDVGEITRIGADGEANRTDIAHGPTTPAKCLVAGELYGLDNGLRAVAGSRELWIVTRWDGAAWTPVPDGAFARSGEEATIRCRPDGFVVEDRSPEVPLQVWTPSTGWRPPPAAIALLHAGRTLTSSTGDAYLPGPDGVQRLSLTEGLVPTPLTAERLAGLLPPEAIQVVDDAGDLMVACGNPTPGLLRCLAFP